MDPLRLEQRTFVCVTSIGAVLVACCALFASRPLDTSLPPEKATSTSPTQTAAASYVPLDRSAFDVELWRALPGRSKGSFISNAETAGARLGNLELIGILEHEGVLTAALYDRGGDRLHIVRSGDSLGASRIEQIERDAIVLLSEGKSMRLALEVAK